MDIRPAWRWLERIWREFLMRDSHVLDYQMNFNS